MPNIFVLCGPSGCGKSTLIARLMGDYPGRFGFSVSHTTRQPRVGESNGVHYHFTDTVRMQAEVDAGMFLEHAIVHGNHYGTSFAAIDSVIGNGKICILDIDVQGVDNMKKSTKIDQSRVVYVMLVPPSIEELERRLKSRSTDSHEVIARRVERAAEEMKYTSKEDYWTAIVVNDNIDHCYSTLVELVERQFRLGDRSSSTANSPKSSNLLGTLSARKPLTSGTLESTTRS